MWIAHLIFSLNIGGTENMLIDITREQSRQVNVLLIIVNNDYDPGLLATISRKVKVILIDRRPDAKYASGAKSLLHFARINALLLYYRPVAIHCHNQKLIEGLFFKPLKNKAVFTAHTTGLALSLTRRYRKCFAISEGVKAEILRRGELAVEVIYNGVHVDRVQCRDLSREQRKVPGDPFKIIQLGRLDHVLKGQDLLLYALKELKEAGLSDIRVDFYGDGASKDFLKELTRDLNLSKNVRFLGAADRSEVYQKLCNYQLLVQPSFKEGFGLSVVEGIMAGIPVLVSDIEGPMEVIGQGEYGFYFKTGDVDDLKERLLWVMTHYYTDEVKSKVATAILYAKEHFDIRNTARRYLEAYKRL